MSDESEFDVGYLGKIGSGEGNHVGFIYTKLVGVRKVFYFQTHRLAALAEQRNEWPI